MMSALVNEQNFDEMLKSVNNTRERIKSIAFELHSLKRNDSKKHLLERQISLLSSRYERDMHILSEMCEHQWESKYDYDNLRYEECLVCSNVRRF